MTVEMYAMSILVEHGCDCYTYGGENSKTIMEDLKEAYPNGMTYPYIEVANAILAISKVKPIVRAPYKMVWETANEVNAIECESLEEAKARAEDTLIEWMVEERASWKKPFAPTTRELDNYNYMIDNCFVRVEKYNPDIDDYTEVWSPNDEETKVLGWKELPRAEIRAEERAVKGEA